MRNAAFWTPWPTGVLLLAATLSLPTVADAQAWLPDQGRGSLYVGYQYEQAHWTLFPGPGPVNGPYVGGPGNKAFHGEHYGKFVTADLDYGVLHGLAITAHLGFVSSRYDGLRPHRDRAGQVMKSDNGRWHGTLQDAEVGLHYTVLRAPLAVSPFVSYLFPVRRYEDRGHAASGHHLRELRVGAALARTLRPFLGDAYAQVTYGYSNAEREADHHIHRHRVDMELGYFVTSRLSLKGAASWKRTAGGIDWFTSSPEYIRQAFVHDALANERAWRVGGGAGYALTQRFNLYMTGFTTVSGASTHAMNTIGAGIGWNFTTPWAD
jgi:hypothetical protein